MRRRRRGRLVGALLMAGLALGCDAAVPSLEPATDPPVRTQRPPTAAPVATPRPTTLLESVSAGAWRPKPVGLTPEDVLPLPGQCRASVEAIGDAPAVLVDVRGDRQLTIVFVSAAGDGAWVCRATALGDVSVVTVDVPSDPPAADGVDALLYRRFVDGDGTRTLLVGRVGPDADEVIAGFDDESFVWATDGGGWYAMWWPGATNAANVASVDIRDFVLQGVDLDVPAE